MSGPSKRSPCNRSNALARLSHHHRDCTGWPLPSTVTTVTQRRFFAVPHGQARNRCRSSPVLRQDFARAVAQWLMLERPQEKQPATFPNTYTDVRLADSTRCRCWTMDLKTYRARWRVLQRKAKAERLQRAQQRRQNEEPPASDPEMQRRIMADLAKMRAAFGGEEDR